MKFRNSGGSVKVFNDRFHAALSYVRPKINWVGFGFERSHYQYHLCLGLIIVTIERGKK